MKFLYSLIFLACGASALALPLDTYRSHSRLSQGRWVRVAVKQTGIYTVPASTLRSYGFPDVSKVRIYGTGGARIPDLLSADTYVDDLAPCAAVTTSRGLTFFGVGTEGWSLTSDKHFDFTANPFTTTGYYYLSDVDTGDESPLTVETLAYDGREAATTFTERTYHEQNLSSPGQTGHMLLGEDFRFSPSQVFSFNMPGRVEGTQVWAQTRFFADVSSDATLGFTANSQGIASSPSDKVRSSGTDSDIFGTWTAITKTFDAQGEKLAYGIRMSGGGTVRSANLDNITVNYVRKLDVTGLSWLTFNADNAAVSLSGMDSGWLVWDVTNPQHPSQMAVSSGKWLNPYGGQREYVAFNPEASFPAPSYVGTVANQDIHGMEAPDMVIITTSELEPYAEQVARLHRTDPVDPLSVLVLKQDDIFHEFGSGCPDVGAMRRMLKMFYDRSVAAASDSTALLRYAMVMGHPTYDQRHLTAANRNTVSVPTWATETGANLSSSYSTDDIMAMLADDSGLNFAADRMDIALGRLSARDATQAKLFVENLTKYMRSPLQGEWRNQIMLVADDQDRGQHMQQTEAMEQNIRATTSDVFFQKVYLDEFELVGGRFEKAREKMYRLLDNGVIWWNWVGHGARQSLAHEFQLAPPDLASLYLRRPPVFYGATCTFGVLDRDDQGGTESLVLEPTGGCMAAIAPQRPVYIAQNGVLTANMGRELFDRDERGMYRPLGEVLRRVKNRTNNDANKRRFVLLGDPAMRLGVPSHRVVLDQIDGVDVTEQNQVTVPARRQAMFSGRVTDGLGQTLDNFDGQVDITLYDAEFSTTTRGRSTDDNSGVAVTFEQQGGRVAAATDSVRNGRFSVRVALPAEISENFRPAAANMYARSATGVEAMGCNREFYLYGVDETAQADTIAPKIEYFYLNHESFANGDIVNENPMVIAKVSDNVAVNLSTAGVGHEISLRLDSNVSYSDLSLYYTPTSDGGTIAYPLESLAEGQHRLTLKVWDTDGNSTSQNVDFEVRNGMAPTIFDTYSDANPASIEANFYVSHNRPDAMLTVKIEVFSMGGRLEWARQMTGRADMFKTSPMTWDLTDGAGHRVPRGIYLYRVTVSTPDGLEAKPVTKRIAVTAG